VIGLPMMGEERGRAAGSMCEPAWYWVMASKGQFLRPLEQVAALVERAVGTGGVRVRPDVVTSPKNHALTLGRPGLYGWPPLSPAAVRGVRLAVGNSHVIGWSVPAG